MSRFELDEAAVAACEQKLFETGLIVNTEAGKARDAISGLQGSGWQGGAGTAANNKQFGEFSDTVAKLHAEIEHIAESLGLGRKATMAEDMNAEESLLAINPDGDGMNFSRI